MMQREVLQFSPALGEQLLGTRKLVLRIGGARDLAPPAAIDGAAPGKLKPYVVVSAVDRTGRRMGGTGLEFESGLPKQHLTLMDSAPVWNEEIELEMFGLSAIQIDKQRGLMCVTGLFVYDVPEHYNCYAVESSPKSRALFHFDTSEGYGVWSGSYRANRVQSLMRLSPHIRNKSHFNPERIDFAAELQRFKRRQTSEKHVPKPPKPAAGRGRRAAR